MKFEAFNLPDHLKSTLEDVAMELDSVVREVLSDDHAETGSITLKLKVARTSERNADSVAVVPELSVKHPPKTQRGAVLFINNNGAIVAQKARQLEMPQLRKIVKEAEEREPATEENEE